MTEAAPQKIKVEYVALSKLVKWPRNPKTHNQGALLESMARFGFTNPLIVDEGTGKLIAGHGRLEALQASHAEGAEPPDRIVAKGRQWLVPVLRGISFRDEKEAEAYLLADNRQAEIGGWDEAALQAVLNDLDNYEGIGFSPRDLDQLLAGADFDPDDIVEATKPEGGDAFGDIYRPLEERAESYLTNAIRQIVLYIEADQYEGVLAKLDRIKEVTELEDNTQIFMAMLDSYAKQVEA